MATLEIPKEQTHQALDSQGYDEFEGITNECKQLLLFLPRVKGWKNPHLYRFQGFWSQPREIQATISAQNHFQARDTDVIVATVPKSGTTWLKAIVFAIVNRDKSDIRSETHPLLSSNPHDLVPFLEFKVYANNRVPDLERLPSPRLFATHVPYDSLPTTIITSKCKIVYICRNLYDTFVSMWHFVLTKRPTNLGPLPIEEVFDMYCKGQVSAGPYWDHILKYWEESLRAPQKVMFLKYEDLKSDVNHLHLRKLAEFLGYPFSYEEEKNGVIKDLSKLCSFENLKDLDVNKKGNSVADFDNKSLFRKGKVGDWKNHLTLEMVEKLGRIIEERFAGSGLKFSNVS